jgi:putative MATE family efflux protein
MKQKSLIEDRSFYRRVFTLAFPIIIQNSITNMVALLDNLMVGQLGTAPMSGVSIANQLLFVFNLIVFGATSGTGIFTAQFYGSSDDEGVRQTFRFKMILSIVMTGVCVAVFSVWSDGLVGMFLQGDGDATDAELMLAYGKTYLKIMLIGLLPFAASSSYSSTLRECGETKVPMIASIMAVCTNLLLNYFLIFGHFGFPAMGVLGAAVATVISSMMTKAGSTGTISPTESAPSPLTIPQAPLL